MRNTITIAGREIGTDARNLDLTWFCAEAHTVYGASQTPGFARLECESVPCPDGAN